MRQDSLVQDWSTRPERGAASVIRLGVWVALRLRRRFARWFLYPVCLYFIASSPAAVGASRAYLARVLGRAPRLPDIFRHFLTFAACVLDRVFLLNELHHEFEVTVHGEDILQEIERTGGGCMLFGAHFGSFEVARAIGRRRAGVPISLLMYEENAKKIRMALAAINPRLETEVIGLGRADSLIVVADRLAQGHFIGVLADRNVDGRDMARYPFLGGEAAFPQGPFRVAQLLGRPVVAMFGVYRGGRRYELFFEMLSEAPRARGPEAAAVLETMMRRYVERLEHHCRTAPFNWFNFYDFWV